MLTPEEFQQISTQIPYIDSLGTDAATVADMGSKRRRHLAMVCEMLLSRLLADAKAGTPDVAGVCHHGATKRCEVRYRLGTY
jgi:hypothetical protein